MVAWGVFQQTAAALVRGLPVQAEPRDFPAEHAAYADAAVVDDWARPRLLISPAVLVRCARQPVRLAGWLHWASERRAKRAEQI